MDALQESRSALKIKLFGNPAVTQGGIHVAFPMKKTEGLFYYLLLNGESTRGQLAPLFWGERDEISADKNLRNSIYMLRKLFSKNAVQGAGSRVKIADDMRAATDLHLMKTLESPRTAGLELYTQELLSGFEILDSEPFTLWLRDTRQAMRVRVLEHLKSRIKNCYDDRNKQELYRSLVLLTSLDLTDEGYFLELMDLYVRDKKIPQAIELFRTYEKRLNEELNLEPGERMLRFYGDLTEKKKNHSPSSPKDELFLGRAEEADLVWSFTHTPAPDRASCIHVRGEPGVGKSSFIRHVAQALPLPAASIVDVQALKTEVMYLLTPWNEIVRRLHRRYDLESVGLDDISLSLLAAAFPGILERHPATSTLELSSLFKERNPVALGHILASLFRRLHQRGDLILLLDDIQWFDEMSLHLLVAFLAAVDFPLVVFMSSCETEGQKTRGSFQELQRKGDLRLLEIELLPFSRSGTVAFFASFFNGTAFTDADIDKIYRATSGLPFLLQEVAHALSQDASLCQKDLQAIDLQNQVDSIIAWRYRDIAKEELQLLEAVSICASDSHFDTMCAFLKIDSLALSNLAAGMVHKGILEEAEEDGEPCLRFRHGYLKDFFYKNIPHIKRREMHRALSVLLEKIYDPERWYPSLSFALPYHLNRASLPERELTFRIDEMRVHLMLYQEFFPTLEDKSLRCSVIPLRGREEVEKRLRDMNELLEEILQRGCRFKNLKLKAGLLELEGGYKISQGKYPEGLEALRCALELAEEEGFQEIFLSCLKHLCSYGALIEDFQVIRENASALLAAAVQHGHEPYKGLALRLQGLGLQIEGKYEEAKNAFNKSAEVFERLKNKGHNFTLAALAAQNSIGTLYHSRGCCGQALAIFEECADICEKKNIFWGISLFHSNAANVAFDMNRRDLMRRHAARSVELFERGTGGRSGSVAYSLKAIEDFENARYGEALTALRRSESLCVPLKKKTWISVHYMAAYLLKLGILLAPPSAVAPLMEYLDQPPLFYARKAESLFKELKMQPRIQWLQDKMRRHP